MLDRLTLPCPHPECRGMLVFRLPAEAGEYCCLCHACHVQLTWEGETARVTLVERDPCIR